jgi:beta-galactosidase
MLRACARTDTIPLVPAGHVVGWEQFVLASPAGPRQRPSGGHVDVERRKNSIVMAAGGRMLAIDRKTGLVRLTKAGNLLLSGGSPHFYRAPTDNDLGTGTDAEQAPWRSMSDSRQVEAVTITLAQGDAAGVLVRFSLGAGAASMTVKYVMDGSGELDATATFSPLRADLPPPTRIGLAFAMPPRFTTMRWYGRGPHESYADRKRSAAIGIWQGAIADQYHDYIRPQDTGNKTDVRWMELSGGGSNLRIEGHRPLGMTALAFPYDDLFRRPPGTWKSTDVVPRGMVTVLVDGAQAGIGGDTTWNKAGRPLPQYRSKLSDYTFGFTMQ